MKEIDFERAALLMGIMEKQANVSPMLTPISGEAGEGLKDIVEDCRQNALERADKTRQEEQVAEQQRLEAVKEHDAQNVQPRGPIQPAEGQALAPGLPVPGPQGNPPLTDKNRDGIDDSQPVEPADRSGGGIGPYDRQEHPHNIPEPETVGRRL